VSEPSSRPYHGVDKVDELAEWTLSEDARDLVLKHGRVGGFESWVPLATLGSSSPKEATAISMANVAASAKALHLAERLIVDVRATVSWAFFQDCRKDAEAAGDVDSDAAGPADMGVKDTDTVTWHVVGKRQQKRRRRAVSKESRMDQLTNRTGFRLSEATGDDVESLTTVTSATTELFGDTLRDADCGARGVWIFGLLGLNGDVLVEAALPLQQEGVQPANALATLLHEGFDVDVESVAGGLPLDVATHCCVKLQGVQVLASLSLSRSALGRTECVLLSLGRHPTP
jgi:hypothetical protein